MQAMFRSSLAAASAAADMRLEADAAGFKQIFGHRAVVEALVS